MGERACPVPASFAKRRCIYANDLSPQRAFPPSTIWPSKTSTTGGGAWYGGERRARSKILILIRLTLVDAARPGFMFRGGAFFSTFLSVGVESMHRRQAVPRIYLSSAVALSGSAETVGKSDERGQTVFGLITTCSARSRKSISLVSRLRIDRQRNGSPYPASNFIAARGSVCSFVEDDNAGFRDDIDTHAVVLQTIKI